MEICAPLGDETVERLLIYTVTPVKIYYTQLWSASGPAAIKLIKAALS